MLQVLEEAPARQAPARLTNRQMVELVVPTKAGMKAGPVHKAIRLVSACDIERSPCRGWIPYPIAVVSDPGSAAQTSTR